MKILTCLKPYSRTVIKPCVPNLLFLALLLLAAALACSITPAFAASQKNANTKAKNANLNVISDEMIAEQNKSMVEFIGNVKATQDDSVLLADSVKVYFNTENKKDGQGNVRQIVATGNVEYTAGDRKAYADKAVYTAADEVLVLTGKAPKLLTGKSWVTGKKITLFRLDERIMVESDGRKRVQAFFDAQDQKRPTDSTKN